METDLEGDVLEIGAEIPLVATIGSRGDAEHLGVAVEVMQHALITIGEGVVGLVDHNEVEVIARPTEQTLFTHERLDGRDDDGGGEAGEGVAALGLGNDASGAGELVGGLREQFLAVREDQRAAGSEPLGGVRENHRLAGGGREDGKEFAALTELREHGLDARRLVGAKVKTAHCWRPPARGWWTWSERRRATQARRAARARARCWKRPAARATPRPCCWRGR